MDALELLRLFGWCCLASAGVLVAAEFVVRLAEKP